MTFKIQNVKRYKRGATWENGETRTCTRCRADHDIKRAKAAVVVGNLKHTGSRFVTPVGYCEVHIPEEIR